MAFQMQTFERRYGTVQKNIGGSGLALAEKCGRRCRPSFQVHRSDCGLAACEHTCGLAVFAHVHFRVLFVSRTRSADQLHLAADDVNNMLMLARQRLLSYANVLRRMHACDRAALLRVITLITSTGMICCRELCSQQQVSVWV